jgi:chorismate dehydratase
MLFRVAAVSYLNAWPIVAGLRERAAADVAAGRTAELELTFDVPSRLADLLYEDRADVALLPVIEYFRGTGAAVVPGTALATRGPVDSVKLFTRVAPAAIGRVLVDKGSRTSVALLRILLAELHGVRPDFHAADVRVGDLLRDEEAALVIGDLCFEAERRFRTEADDRVQILDLGAAWHKLTGLPFVFAVWTLGRGFDARAGLADKKRLARLLGDARDAGLSKIDELAAQAAAAGHLGPGGEASEAAIRRYFRQSMLYTLGEREMAGLLRFHELCLRHAICPPGRVPTLAAAVESD